MPRINADLHLVALFKLSDRRCCHLVHHILLHGSRRVEGGACDEAVGRIVSMTSYVAASLTTNLHGDAVDIEFLALRTSNGKLYILVGRVIFSSHPCAILAGAHQQAVRRSVAIFHHTLNLGSSSSCIAVNYSIVIAGQGPCGSEGVAASQLDAVDGDSSLDGLLTQRGGDGTCHNANGSNGYLGIEGLDKCAALVAHLQRVLPVLLVGRKLDALSGTDGDGAFGRLQTQTAQRQFLGG